MMNLPISYGRKPDPQRKPPKNDKKGQKQSYKWKRILR